MKEQEVWIHDYMICVGEVWTMELKKDWQFKVDMMMAGYIQTGEENSIRPIKESWTL